MRESSVVSLGSFKLTGGQLLVTDPCYDKGTWCSGVVKDAKNGTWHSYVEAQDFGRTALGGRRIARLWAEAEGESHAGNDWLTLDADIGVDSGQAGIFSYNKYPDEPGEDPFYDRCCDKTLGPSQAGVLNEGVVSSSGFGDGGYTCRYRKNAEGKVVCVEVTFIDESEDEP